MTNPDSPLALILAFFAPAAAFLAVAGMVWIFGYFIVWNLAVFVIQFLHPESAIPLALLAASGVVLLVIRALPNPSVKNGDSK